MSKIDHGITIIFRDACPPTLNIPFLNGGGKPFLENFKNAGETGTIDGTKRFPVRRKGRTAVA
jgi:hypothetical protein